MKEQIEKIIEESGLWTGERRMTHRFLLTPEVFSLSQESTLWLKHLGPALTECLSGLGRIAAIASDQHLAKNQTWHTIRRLAQAEVSPLFRKLQLARPSTPPLIFRIDVVESEDDRLFVVEIEAMKSHGLGYASLFARIAKLSAHSVLPGVAALLAREVIARRPHDPTLVLLYADNERFYQPEFEVLRRDLDSKGVKLVVASEHAVSISEASIRIIGGNSIEHPLLVGLPVFFGSRDHKPNRDAEAALGQLYLNGMIDCLIPPKPFLASKAMMALIRNDTGNEDVEAILCSQINRAALATVRAALPETYLIERSATRPNISKARFVLKDTISSGAHGITFSDRPEFERALARAERTTGRFILQQMVATRRREFNYYPKNSSKETADTWYTRIGVFYVTRELAEVCITGCRKLPVHGGPEAIFMGSALTQ